MLRPPNRKRSRRPNNPLSGKTEFPRPVWKDHEGSRLNTLFQVYFVTIHFTPKRPVSSLTGLFFCAFSFRSLPFILNGMKQITSTANPIVKKLRGLSLRKNRDAENLFIVEGARHIEAALDAGWTPDILAFAPDKPMPPSALFEKASRHKCLMVEAGSEILSSITGRENTQAIIASFYKKDFSSDIQLDTLSGLVLALEEIRDPGNLGTIIRTSDATGVDTIYLLGDTCDPYAPETIRASMGSFAHVPVLQLSATAFAAQCAHFKGTVIGTHLHANAIDYRDMPVTRPLMLVMGSEKHGLSEEIAQTCDQLVKIPMREQVESLNLAVSTGILLYQVSGL